VRLRFVGYTGNERLDRRTAAVYGDDVGLSAARARRAMEIVTDQMHLRASQAEHEGRGYVQSSDVVHTGFTQGESSEVVVQVVFVFQQTPDEGLVAAPVRFHMYTNYGAFIERAEVRIFEAGLSTQSTPLAVVAIDPNRSAEWQPGAKQLSAAGKELQYLVRAY